MYDARTRWHPGYPTYAWIMHRKPKIQMFSPLYFGYSIKREPALCAPRRRSPGPTDSHERVSIFISLYYLLTFSPRNRFFFHGPLLHTPFIIQKKKKKDCVCADIILYIIYAYIYIYVKGLRVQKPVFLEKKKKHATVTHPVKGLHKIYTYTVRDYRGEKKKCTHDTHDPRSMLI